MRKRYFVGAGIVIAVVLVFGWFFRKPATAGKAGKPDDPNVVELGLDAQKNAQLKAEPVRIETMRESIRVTGIVAPDEARVAHIFPLAQGVAERPFVRLGDRVEKGQPLLLYDNIELGDVVGQHLSAHGELEKEKAQLVVTRKSFERAKTLIESEAISPREFEVRKAEQGQAEAAVQSKEADLSRLEEKLHRFGLNEVQVKSLSASNSEAGHRTASHNILRAPFAGTITKYDVSQGESITREKELFTLVDASSVWVLGDIYEKDIARVSPRGECQVQVSSYPGETFRGQIAYVSDFLDPASRTAKVRCVVPNKDGRLKLEMFADVLLPVVAGKAAPVVPSTAIQEINGRPVAFVQRDATHFEKRELKLGEHTQEQTQIMAGLMAGEKVVTVGSFYLKSAFMREEIGGEE